MSNAIRKLVEPVTRLWSDLDRIGHAVWVIVSVGGVALAFFPDSRWAGIVIVACDGLWMCHAGLLRRYSLQRIDQITELNQHLAGSLQRKIEALPPLLQSIAQADRAALVDSIDRMCKGAGVLYVRMPTSVLLDRFRAILRSVASKSTMHVVTVDRFWAVGNMGGGNLEEYVRANLDLVRRGVTVVRYLVVEQEWVAEPHKMKGYLREAIWALQAASEQAEPGKLQLHVVTRQEIMRSYHDWSDMTNFALWDGDDEHRWYVEMEHREFGIGEYRFASMTLGRLADDAKGKHAQLSRALSVCETVAKEHPALPLVRPLRGRRPTFPLGTCVDATVIDSHGRHRQLPVTLLDYDDRDGNISVGISVAENGAAARFEKARLVELACWHPNQELGKWRGSFSIERGPTAHGNRHSIGLRLINRIEGVA